MLKRILASALLALATMSSAFAQVTSPAKVSGVWFSLGRLTNPITATTSSAATLLPAPGFVALVCNTGSNDAYVSFGTANTVTADSGDSYVKAQTCTAFDRKPQTIVFTYMAAVSSTGTTTLTVETGSGEPPNPYAGGGGGGGGGGTVTQGPAGTAPWFVGGQYNATPPTLSDGSYSGLQLDSSGNLNVNIKAGAGSGGTALADEGAFTQGTTNFTPMGGYYNSSPVDLTSGQAGSVVMTAHRAMTIDVLPNSTMYSLMSSGAATVGATFPSSVIGVGGKDGSGNIQPPIMSNYGTAPGASPALGVNAYVTNTPTVQGGAASGVSVSGNPVQLGGRAASSNPTAVTNGQAAYQQFDLTGKVVTSPYAIRESQLRCAVSITGTSATTCTGMASQGAGIKIYITDLCIFRSDAGTTAVVATTNAKDSTGTNNITFVLPNNGGGGGACHTYNTPLVVAAATDFQITMGSSISTIYASATGFSGY